MDCTRGVCAYFCPCSFLIPLTVKRDARDWQEGRDTSNHSLRVALFSPISLGGTVWINPEIFLSDRAFGPTMWQWRPQ